MGLVDRPLVPQGEGDRSVTSVVENVGRGENPAMSAGDALLSYALCYGPLGETYRKRATKGHMSLH